MATATKKKTPFEFKTEGPPVEVNRITVTGTIALTGYLEDIKSFLKSTTEYGAPDYDVNLVLDVKETA